MVLTLSYKGYMFKHNWLRVLLIIIIIVAGAFVLNANMLFPWQWNAKRNKRAVLEYITQHFPSAEIVDVDYKSTVLSWMSVPMDTFYLKFDGIEFTLITQKGKVLRDTYHEAKAEKYIRENFIDSFMNERGLSPKVKISFIYNSDDYGKIRVDSLDDIYGFGGSIDVKITQDNIDGIYSPKNVGWFFDFYQYWTENCDLTNCSVYMYYHCNNCETNKSVYRICFESGEMTYSDEKDFYNHFGVI